MRKFERKARLKAMKRAAKEAKRAAREAAAAPQHAAEAPRQGSAQAAVPLHADAPGIACDAGSGCSADSAPQDPTLDQVAEMAAEKLEIARSMSSGQAGAAAEQDAPDRISDSEARAMLARAAKMLDSVIIMTRAALAEVPLPRLREAYEIVKAKPEPAEQAAQKRPRRGYDPVVSLLKTALAAASLVNRILAKTNPTLMRGRKAA